MKSQTNSITKYVSYKVCEKNQSGTPSNKPAVVRVNRGRLIHATSNLCIAMNKQKEVVRDYQQKNLKLQAEIEKLIANCIEYRDIAARLSARPLRRKMLRLNSIMSK